ncbi:hypothetical protein F441_08203 [Phytophthora nicotianae CJ01A1]|uniref:BED-type domain-containing protein n=4 Tax=Phytophthora nicotianae TaxID=4792 RepID=W2X3S4_PHYNI|nr:hypothetical protein L916_07976 [Phytophthora nicotianae]ETP17391.1 hypothetical protein F441_08203 [Phytophthora nicotianae CJ01A1]
MTDTLLSAPPTRPTFSPRQIATFFFSPCADKEGLPTGVYACKSCGRCRKLTPKTGYSNLVSHVRTAHPDFESSMRDATVASTGTLLPWVSQKASNRYAWLRWVIMGNLPFSFCESNETRRYTNLNPIFEETLTAIMEAVTKAVEKAIGDEMSENFGLVLDGWTHAPAFVAGPCDEQPQQLNAESHLTAIKRFLPFFGKSVSGCLFLVGDNCAVNKRVSDLLGVPLVGCSSHRLNLAVRDFLEPSEDDLEGVQQLMRKLRTLKQAANLRTKTPLRAVLRQDTRWSSTFSMLKRYFRIREFISADDDELADYLPSRTAHRKLAALLASLEDLESVSKRLQSNGLTLLDALYLFDGLMEIQPSFAKYIGKLARFCLFQLLLDSPTPDFEKAVVNVLAVHAALLTDAETATLKPFKRRASMTSVTERAAVTKEGFAERILNRCKVPAAPATYMLLGAIPPTSNIVERLFSMARAVLRHERHRLSPILLEMILFLKVNSSRWDVATV